MKTEDPKANLISIAALIVSFTHQLSVFFEGEPPFQHYEKEIGATSTASGFQFPNLYHEHELIENYTMKKQQLGMCF